MAAPSSHPLKKITVYTEDPETICFSKCLLVGRIKHLKFIPVSISCSKLIDLVKIGVPAFLYPYSIVIVDGDVIESGEKKNLNAIKDNRTLLILPTKFSPERLVANFLNDLHDDDNFWEDIAKGFSKQVCFKDYSYKDIMDDRDKAKKWFNYFLSKGYWGVNASKVFKPIIRLHQSECDTFIKKCDKVIEGLDVVNK